MNMPLALLNRRRRGAVAFSPTALFASNEPGVWYDPSDLTTLFQDTAGTTPVTTPGQSVALALDKSKGLVLGSELVTSPYTGSVSASWAVTSTNVTRNGSSTGQAVLSLSTAIDTAKRYYVTFTVADLSGDTMLIRIGGSGTAYQVSANGVYTARLIGGGTGSSITFAPWAGSAGQATITNISVKELPGFHATQATAGSRPIYGIVPVGGRRNLLTFTEQFDNAAWSKDNSSITANAAIAPDGTTTADKLVEAATTNVHFAGQSVTVAAGSHSFSAYLKAAERTFAILYYPTGNVAIAVNLSTGATGQPSGTVAPASSSVTSVGNGWYRVSMVVTTTAASQAFRIYLSDTLTGTGSYTGNGTSGILIWGAQLETGSTATAYQRVVSQYDVTEAGVSSLSYLAFDGVDDFLITPTITPGIDKAQVFAGVRKLSDAAAGTLIESSSNAGANNGAFYVVTGPDPLAANRYSSMTRGSLTVGTLNAATTNNGNAPDTAVLSTTHDIAGDLTTIRRNGVSGISATTDLGTGNFLAYPMYIGRRNGVASPLNGQIFSLIVRFGANLTADQITSTETWVNGKTRAY